MTGPLKLLTLTASAALAWIGVAVLIGKLAGADLVALLLCLLLVAIIVAALAVTEEFGRMRAAMTPKPTRRAANTKAKTAQAAKTAELQREMQGRA